MDLHEGKNAAQVVSRKTRGPRDLESLMSLVADRTNEEVMVSPMVRTVIRAFLEAEMAEAVAAQKGERVEGRLSYRSAYYACSLITRVGKLELRAPRSQMDVFPPRFLSAISAARKRSWRRSRRCISNGSRPAKSLRSVKSSAGTVLCERDQRDQQEVGYGVGTLRAARYPYLIIDARSEKLRENGVIRSGAVIMAIGIDWEDRRQVLGVEMANRESSTSWKSSSLD